VAEGTRTDGNEWKIQQPQKEGGEDGNERRGKKPLQQLYAAQFPRELSSNYDP